MSNLVISAMALSMTCCAGGPSEQLSPSLDRTNASQSLGDAGVESSPALFFPGYERHTPMTQNDGTTGSIRPMSDAEIVQRFSDVSLQATGDNQTDVKESFFRDGRYQIMNRVVRHGRFRVERSSVCIDFGGDAVECRAIFSDESGGVVVKSKRGVFYRVLLVPFER